MPYIITVFDLKDCGHGELMSIVGDALRVEDKQFSVIRVEFKKENDDSDH